MVRRGGYKRSQNSEFMKNQGDGLPSLTWSWLALLICLPGLAYSP